MPQPIKLTYAEVVEAGRKAYLEKRLSAQGPTPECRYRDQSGRPCIIGAALDAATAATFDCRLEDGGNAGIRELVAAGLLDADDEDGLAKLQEVHDGWASARERGDRLLAEGSEFQLRKLLNIEEAA